MGRLLGILLMVGLLYAALIGMDEGARTLPNHQTIGGRIGFYGVPTVGVGLLILSGGIDLSIGSVVGLGAVCFGLLVQRQVNPWLAAGLVLCGSALIGLIHGLLVTQLRLQPFLVTLCGMFIYRGLARWATPSDVGLTVRGAPASFTHSIEAMRQILVGTTRGAPNMLLLLIGVALVLGLFLHGTRHGRYLFALGANEEAARYAGIPTSLYRTLAYVICSLLAGLASVLELLDVRTVNAVSAGSWYELYAITGAVLGGCSLRGGEGNVAGMVLGAAVLPLLRQLCLFGGISNELELAVIGAALLIGTITDELLKRRAARR